MRRLHLVLGDQLDLESSLFEEFDPELDSLWMAEADGENTQVPHHKHQIVLFLSAMRHFAQAQGLLGRPILYTELSQDPQSDRGQTLGDILRVDLERHRPQEVRVVLPGDKRVLEQIRQACGTTPLQVLSDQHFFSSPDDFRRHAQGRKTLRLEYFYRELRRAHQILIDSEGGPVGGQWNYDADNRQAFGAAGPPVDNEPERFAPDQVVSEVCRLVETRYPEHPGSSENFSLPVRREQALRLLDQFIETRLSRFGDFQDAMWQGEFYLYHSRLSTALNLKLLSPKEVCVRAEAAYHNGSAPLNAVEGFIRQILGWREYIRGIYWTAEDGYERLNVLEHHEDLPGFFWTGETEMACLADTLRNVQQNAYSHHIQRLMVSGLFCLLYGVEPSQFNNWHLATHCDAIDWVSTPNVIGMSQFADGGLLASKPYCASGNYIHKMSNYCGNCTYNPKLASGDKACPFTTLYWEFLGRHQAKLESNPRMTLQVRNWQRKSAPDQSQILEAADRFRQRLRAALT